MIPHPADSHHAAIDIDAAGDSAIGQPEMFIQTGIVLGDDRTPVSYNQRAHFDLFEQRIERLQNDAIGINPQDAIKRRLPPNAQLIVGDVTHTVPEFVRSLQPSAPLGLAVIDVDYYWSTKECMPVFLGPAECYLPVTTVYLDDIEFSGMNRWCGELLAVEEFNAEQKHRKIAPMNFLRPGRIFRNAKWIDHMFSMHVLDHSARSTIRAAGGPAIITNPYL